MADASERIDAGDFTYSVAPDVDRYSLAASCCLVVSADRRLHPRVRWQVLNGLRAALVSRDDIRVRPNQIASNTGSAGTVFVVRANYEAPLFVDEVETAGAGQDAYHQAAATLHSAGRTAIERALGSGPSQDMAA